MSASKGERERIRRSRYQAIDFRTSHIADGWLHDPSHGQDQSPDEIIGRHNTGNMIEASDQSLPVALLPCPLGLYFFAPLWYGAIND